MNSDNKWPEVNTIFCNMLKSVQKNMTPGLVSHGVYELIVNQPVVFTKINKRLFLL